MIASAAIQEDVDVVGLSIMSGAHNHLVPEIARLLRDKGADDIPLVLGGIIPQDDFQEMEKAGVKAIFTPGTALTDLVEAVRSLGEAKRASEH
jgi:methylmalonyl-CoA mutase C-terminal domain/subunit